MLFVMLPLLAAAGARADTAVQSGLWEKTEKVTLDSRELPARPRRVCLKEGDASLERLLLVNDDEAKARGCTSEVAPLEAGRVRMGMSCPATDDEPAVIAKLEVRYTPTSFEGTGSVEITPKAGHTQKGISALSGKRLGDC